MRIRFFVAILLVAGATGCPKDPVVPPPADAGTSSSVGRSCSVDAECEPLRCDSIRHQCICLSDADCPGQFCNNFTGLCVATVSGCTDSSACAAGQYCNPSTRACANLEPFCSACTASAECGDGNTCNADSSLHQSFCAQACGDDADCPHGATCQDLGGGNMQCWPAPNSTCKTFTGCEPDALTSCDGPSDCADAGGDQVCNPATGLCQARVQSCALGTVCDPSARVCVNSCTVDQDCADATLKCVNHSCQKLDACTSDTDCPTDKVCNLPPGASGGECVPFCSSDTACAVGTVCQPVLEADGSTRQNCLPGCVHNTDCPLDQVCTDDSGNLFTGGTAGALGTCNGQLGGTQACQTTDACGACETCSSGFQCQAATSAGYCHTCNPQNGNVDCSSFGTNATCLSLGGRDANGNIVSSGPFGCGVPCQAQNACPKGFVCAALTDSSGNTGIYNCVPADFNCASAGAPKCH